MVGFDVGVSDDFLGSSVPEVTDVLPLRFGTYVVRFGRDLWV